MNQSYLQNSDWYHALTLAERIASLQVVHDQMKNIEVNGDSGSATDAALAITITFYY
jgi:hypothetical protein